MKILATAKTEERIIRYISEYWGGATITLHPGEKGKKAIHNLKGLVNQHSVINYRGGFAFIREEETK